MKILLKLKNILTILIVAKSIYLLKHVLREYEPKTKRRQSLSGKSHTLTSNDKRLHESIVIPCHIVYNV